MSHHQRANVLSDSGTKRLKLSRLQERQVKVKLRQCQMAIHRCGSMTRNMLDTGQDSPTL